MRVLGPHSFETRLSDLGRFDLMMGVCPIFYTHVMTLAPCTYEIAQCNFIRNPTKYHTYTLPPYTVVTGYAG